MFVRVHTLCDRFPGGTSQIIGELAALEGHVLIVGMSNLINWIWNESDDLWRARDFEAIEKLTPSEVKALQRLADETAFDSIHVVGVSTRDHSRWYLPRKMMALLDRLAGVFKSGGRPFGSRWAVKARVVFENPEGCGWASRNPTWPSDFHAGTLANVAPSYALDKKLDRALSRHLEAAWAKVSCYMRYESLSDQIELKLFETDLPMSISRLAAGCLDRECQLLNVDQDLPYQYPKDPNSTRPRSLARLEDQIVSAAVLISFAKELNGPCPEVSYSHRFAPRQSEILYRYWFQAHTEYLTEVLQGARKQRHDHYVCQTDIKSYYVNIDQSKLMNVLGRRLRSSCRCLRLLSATVSRDCHAPHAPGYGLLQGHALSGVLSNVMLQSVDSQLVNQRGLRGRYFRFADDIVLTDVAAPLEATALIQEELAALDDKLKLSDEKTCWHTTPEFRTRVSRSRLLSALDKRFRALLLPLYVVNLSYRGALSAHGWQFVHRYQQLLQKAGVAFTPEWLYRKLGEYGSPWRWMKARKRRWYLHWPRLSLAENSAGRLGWQSEFQSRNPSWVNEKQALKGEMSTLLLAAAKGILAAGLPEEELTRRRRSVKFALYRLSVLGVERVAREVAELVISQPWNIPCGLACQALAKIQDGQALLRVLGNCESSYARAVALRALGKMRTYESVEALASAMDRSPAPIETLMASEALLDANVWGKITLARVMSWLVQQAADPYIQKNVVLILGQAFPDDARDVLLRMRGEPLHPVVHRAIHYALNKPRTESLLRRPEPAVLRRKYRASSYPIIEELLGEEGYYDIVS